MLCQQAQVSVLAVTLALLLHPGFLPVLHCVPVFRTDSREQAVLCPTAPCLVPFCVVASSYTLLEFLVLLRVCYDCRSFSPPARFGIVRIPAASKRFLLAAG